jgi:polysaccharide biosynthesis protein PslH
VTAGVVWVTAEVPDRDGGGGNIRQAHLFAALAQHTPVDLLVAGEVRDTEVLDAARHIIQVPPVALPSDSRVARRAQAAFTAWARRRPLDVAAHGQVRAALAEELGRLSRDASALLLHHQVLGPLLARPRDDRARWALTLFHASGRRSFQEAAVEPSRLQRALLRQDGRNAARAERRYVEAADRLVVLSEEDAQRLGRPGTPTHLVQQGVDLRRFPVTPLPAAPVVLFPGSLDYSPNIDGSVWFVDAMWPAIRARVPDAQLRIVGRQPPREVRALHGQPGVEVHADVPSMAPWLAAARVSVAPLRIGTGVRMKAMEALAAQRPLVGTTIALEGLPLTEAEAAIVDEPGAFADAVVALLLDDELAERRRSAGRLLVEQHFSWSVAGAQLADALLG